MGKSRSPTHTFIVSDVCMYMYVCVYMYACVWIFLVTSFYGFAKLRYSCESSVSDARKLDK